MTLEPLGDFAFLKLTQTRRASVAGAGPPHKPDAPARPTATTQTRRASEADRENKSTRQPLRAQY